LSVARTWYKGQQDRTSQTASMQHSWIGSSFRSSVTDLVQHIDQEANILQVFNLAGELDIGIPADRCSQVKSALFCSCSTQDRTV
jgi:hypothetical protein